MGKKIALVQCAASTAEVFLGQGPSSKVSTTSPARSRRADIGGDIPGKAKRGQQALAALVKSEIARWTPIIKAANVKGD